MIDDVGKLVERLRDRSDHYVADWAREAMDEAATTIERQAANSRLPSDMHERAKQEVRRVLNRNSRGECLLIVEDYDAQEIADAVLSLLKGEGK